MRLASLTTYFLLFLGILLVFSGRGDATPQGQQEAHPGARQDRGETQPPPIAKQRQHVILAPFYLLQKEGGRAWWERIIVTLEVSMPENCPKLDFTGPTLRKALYDLLRSGQPDLALRSQALFSLNQQVGTEVVTAIKMSRSILIVH